MKPLTCFDFGMTNSTLTPQQVLENRMAHPDLMKKGKGRSIMVSDFLCPCHGRMYLMDNGCRSYITSTLHVGKITKDTGQVSTSSTKWRPNSSKPSSKCIQAASDCLLSISRQIILHMPAMHDGPPRCHSSQEENKQLSATGGLGIRNSPKAWCFLWITRMSSSEGSQKD